MELKLGKREVKLDKRTIPLSRIMVVANLPALPDAYNVLDVLKINDTNTFNNIKYGDCVIAARAHMTLAFETFQQETQFSIPDSAITTEYFLETGGADSGLVMLDSLNKWRQNGWTISGKQYSIDAYASVDWTNHDEVKYCIFLLMGTYFGLKLPLSAQTQYKNGQTWDVVSGPSGIAGSWGLHALYCLGYNATGPICITWGKIVQMTWTFFDAYCDENYGIIDNLDSWIDPAKDPLNIPALQTILQEITGQPLPPPVPAPPNPPPMPTPPAVTTLSVPDGTVGVAYSAKLGASGGTPPYTWSIQSGSLPDGLSLSADGTISGIPTKAGVSGIIFIVKDSAGLTSGVGIYIKINKSSPCKWGNGVANFLNLWPRVARRKGRFYYLNPPNKQ